MSASEQKLQVLKLQHAEFSNMVRLSNKDELAKCAKLLALYLTLYKQQFGEVTLEQHMELIESEEQTQSAEIYNQGIAEVMAMLKTILKERQSNNSIPCMVPSKSIN